MRTKNATKQLRLTEEKKNKLDDFLKDNNISFQELVEPFIDAILENQDKIILDDYFEKNFYKDMCKK